MQVYLSIKLKIVRDVNNSAISRGTKQPKGATEESYFSYLPVSSRLGRSDDESAPQLLHVSSI